MGPDAAEGHQQLQATTSTLVAVQPGGLNEGARSGRARWALTHADCDMSVRLTWESSGVSGRDPFPENSPLADMIMKSVSRALHGREHDGLWIVEVLHYGAVWIDPKYLVVWLLLEGRPDDEIPAWLTITPDLLPSMRPEQVDYDWLLGLRSEVHKAFQDGGWPSADGPTVCVDSRHRVAEGGGPWSYFR